MADKLRVAVIFGGDSNEREISLESGRNVYYKLSSEKYDTFPLFLDTHRKLYRIDEHILVHNTTAEIARELQPSMHIRWSDLPQLVDFVFLGLHGSIGENGTIQGTLEMLGVPYNGPSVLASALCMDKYRTTSFLASQGFAVPRNAFISKEEWLLDRQQTLTQITRTLTLPLVVKPHDDGCSVGVSLATNSQELSNSLDQLFTLKAHALIEEKIEGMELTVGVIGNEKPCALPPSQAVASKAILSIEEKFLPGAGENQTPAPLPPHTLAFIQRTVEAAYQALGCQGYSRIDCFYQTPQQSPTGTERVVFLEVNTLPGLTPATVLFHQAAELGLRPGELLDMIIELGLLAHKPQADKAHTQEEVILRPVRARQSEIAA